MVYKKKALLKAGLFVYLRMRLHEVLHREIMFHSRNGMCNIDNPNFVVQETHKMTGVPRLEVIALFKKFVEAGFIERVPETEYAYRIKNNIPLDRLKEL